MDTRGRHSKVRTPDVRVGDVVVAADGDLGRVDGVIRSESNAPVFLVVAVGRRLRRRHPVVPWSLVRRVDRTRCCVHLEGRRGRLGRLSETLPLVV